MTKKIIIFDTPFDTYTSTSIIGEGGAGRVHAVTNSAGEEFALKCLAPERITSERLKRFKNEIQFCRRDTHSNILKIVDDGVTVLKDTKCPFYVMTRYSSTLRKIMGKQNPEDNMALFSQILNGVEAAHLAGVWHRDLKPENILYDQREKRVCVADFGIAHFEEEEIYTAVETRATDRLANFHYSAPEQRVRNTNVDFRADIFALGLILNEMFTGQVIQGAGYRRIAEINSQYAYLDDIVEAMTQQNPANRPASIEKIKMELIGRKNTFFALQRYDEAKKQVVSKTEPAEFEPIKINNFDYESSTLKLILNRNVPAGWAQEFQNPRGGHSSIVGYGPESFSIQGNIASIRAREDERLIQNIVNHAKEYVNAANRGYAQQMRERAIKEEQQQRAALEKRVAEETMRKNILSNIKL